MSVDEKSSYYSDKRDVEKAIVYLSILVKEEA